MDEVRVGSDAAEDFEPAVLGDLAAVDEIRPVTERTEALAGVVDAVTVLGLRESGTIHFSTTLAAGEAIAGGDIECAASDTGNDIEDKDGDGSEEGTVAET